MQDDDAKANALTAQASSETEVEQFSLRDLLKAKYGPSGYLARLTEHMGMTRQTAYNYSRDGVPERLAGTFRAFCAEEGIEFPEGKGPDDYIRGNNVAHTRPNILAQKNVHLIRMISYLVTQSFVEQYDVPRKPMPERIVFDIEDICRLNFDTVPQRFFRWAFETGGVPPQKIEHVVRAALQHRMNIVLFRFPDTIEGQKEFRSWAHQYLLKAAPDTDDAADVESMAPA